MAVLTVVAFDSVQDVTLNDDSWTSLIGTPDTVVGTGTVMMIQGYVLNLNGRNSRIRFTIDGTEVIKGSPDAPLMYNATLSVGTHTIDFQAIAMEDEEATAGPHGLTVLNLL
jgi:hypothetical protein